MMMMADLLQVQDSMLMVARFDHHALRGNGQALAGQADEQQEHEEGAAHGPEFTRVIHSSGPGVGAAPTAPARDLVRLGGAQASASWVSAVLSWQEHGGGRRDPNPHTSLIRDSALPIELRPRERAKLRSMLPIARAYAGAAQERHGSNSTPRCPVPLAQGGFLNGSSTIEVRRWLHGDPRVHAGGVRAYS